MPNTDGSLSSCLKVYLKNEHPLASLCLADPRHPFGLVNRVGTLLATGCLAFTISAALAYSSITKVRRLLSVLTGESGEITRLRGPCSGSRGGRSGS
jgi:hypothetical protein